MKESSFEKKILPKNIKKIIVLSTVIAVLLVLVAGILYKTSHSNIEALTESNVQEVSTDKPIDIALDFYGPWLDAVKSTSTDPYKSGLPATKILSETLRTQLIASESRAETEIDPVLCQITIPERGRARMVYQNDVEAQVLVTAKEPEITAQSVFTLKHLNEGWFIDSITCYPGEFEAPREFTFEKEGYLLKNVLPPLNSQYWHIVFEENGEKGHAVPLLFDAESSCIAIDGSKTICDPTKFIEATKVHVYSQMTELGADVVRLEFIQ